MSREPSASGLRILVVEDDELIQALIVNQLHDLGFETSVAASAAEARRKLQELRGGLAAVVADVGLPDGGDQLVREICARYPHVPVVISSGYDRAKLEARFADTGALEYLVKPFTQAQLAAALRRIGVLEA